MSRKRKHALEKIMEYVPEVVRHIGRCAAEPGHSSRNKWKNEILGWLLQMEELLPHVGKKTAAEWQTRIDGWRATLLQGPDAE